MRLSDRVVAHAATIMAAAASIALSLVAIARTPLVNNDGARYLAAAEAYAQGGFEAAQRVYPWPFYPALVGLVMPLAGSALAAAYAIDTLLMAVASAAFVLILRELGADRRTELLGAALVLTHPGITSVRAVVIRDFGLWAFALLGLVALLRFLKRGGWPSAASWTACGVAAFLFRPDAAVVWTVSALAPLADREREPTARVARLLALLSFPIAVVLGAFVLSAADPSAWEWAFRANASSWEPSTAGFETAARALGDAFPYRHGREYAPYILLWGLLPILPVKVVRALGVAQTALTAKGAASRPGPPALRMAVWLAFAGAALPLLVLLPRRLFLETRYAVLCSVILLVFAPFALSWMLRSPGPGPRLLAMLLAAGVLLPWAWSLRSPREEAPQLQAVAQWLRLNTPPEARIHTNSPQIAYYSRRRVDWDEVESLLLGRPPKVAGGTSDFYAIVTPRPADEASPPFVVALQAVASFPGGKGDEVIVYRAAPR